MNKKIKELYEEYQWLRITNSVEEYIEPNYYNKLLKDYIFDRKSDIDIFKDFLKSIDLDKEIYALELGCGTGRATNAFINSLGSADFNLELVDLSERMLSFSKMEFSNYKNIKLFKSDSIEFIEKTKEVYDVIFSLWSFSHAVHQTLIKRSLYEGRMYVKSTIRKMVKENMAKSSKFFLIHFDSLSDEQKILMRQWRKAFSIYNNLHLQSPSKRTIDETLQELRNEGIIKLRVRHLRGEAITYYSVEEALKIFLNFHMETYFNKSLLLPNIINELKEYFKKFTDKNGKIMIKPGCFVYEVDKYE